MWFDLFTVFDLSKTIRSFSLQTNYFRSQKFYLYRKPFIGWLRKLVYFLSHFKCFLHLALYWQSNFFSSVNLFEFQQFPKKVSNKGRNFTNWPQILLYSDIWLGIEAMKTKTTMTHMFHIINDHTQCFGLWRVFGFTKIYLFFFYKKKQK